MQGEIHKIRKLGSYICIIEVSSVYKNVSYMILKILKCNSYLVLYYKKSSMAHDRFFSYLSSQRKNFRRF